MNAAQGLSRIVRGYRDRIMRGGGSVIVTASGSVIVNPLSAGGGFLQASGTNVATWGGSRITTYVPIRINTSGLGLVVNTDGVAGQSLITYKRSDAYKLSVDLLANNDVALSAWTGAAGAEVPVEAIRIVNANGYVSFPTRVGIGTAAPAYPLQVNGQSVIVAAAAGGSLWVQSTAATGIAALIHQTAASATVPVLVVKLGGSPGVGGDAVQIQDSAAAVKLLVNATGALKSVDSVNVTNSTFATTYTALTTTGLYYDATLTQTTVGAAGAAAALPTAPTGYAKLRVGASTFAVPYYAAA